MAHDSETLIPRLERLHGFIYSVSGSGENEAHATIRDAIAALTAETARADREAAKAREYRAELESAIERATSAKDLCDREATARREAEQKLADYEHELGRERASVDAMRAENESLRASQEKWRADCIEAESAWGKVVAERDALRVQLEVLDRAGAYQALELRKASEEARALRAQLATREQG